MAAYHNGREITDVRRGRKQIIEIRQGLSVIWELITGFIFTSDGYVCLTEDDYLEKCNDQ